MNHQITTQEVRLLPAQGQAILANIDTFLDQVADYGKQLNQYVLKDAEYLYLENNLQRLKRQFVPGGQIDYNGVKLVRKL